MKNMLEQERLKHGWTQEHVAKQVGITRTAISHLETGIRKPSFDVLVKLLDLFGYKDPRELFAVADGQPISQPQDTTARGAGQETKAG